MRLAFAVATFTAASHQGALAAWSTLARMHHCGGNPRLAMQVLDRALSWEAEHPRTHYRLILWAQRAIAQAERGAVGAARTDLALAEAEGLEGPTYQAYLDLAHAFIAVAEAAVAERKDRAAALAVAAACCRKEHAEHEETAYRVARPYWKRLRNWRAES